MAEIIVLILIVVMVQRVVSGVKEAGKQSGNAPSAAPKKMEPSAGMHPVMPGNGRQISKAAPVKQDRNGTQGQGRKMESVSGRIRREQEAVPNIQKVQPAKEFTFGDNSAPSAKRLIEGDSIPQGYNMVKCSYCGAENLVSRQRSGRYACYFCREIL